MQAHEDRSDPGNLKFVFFVVACTFYCVHARSQYMYAQCVRVTCVRMYVCVRVRVYNVCLHIYRYIGTYIDRSKIAHASAHTSIYMHRINI